MEEDSTQFILIFAVRVTISFIEFLPDLIIYIHALSFINDLHKQAGLVKVMAEYQ